MNTYYLVDDTKNGITINHAMSQGFESGSVVKVKRNGLEAALKELAELAKRNGRRRKLEIHCHGMPAELQLGAPRAVTNTNVHMLGTAIKQVLMPGSMIEVLACRVAAPGDSYGLRSLMNAPRANITGYREEYHGALRLRKTRIYYQRDSDNKPDFSKAIYGGGSTARADVIKDDPTVFFTPEFETDGLRFCLSLATSSGCVVRAACFSQEEEGNSEDMLDSPIGNWEFEVFDFLPGGSVQFLGSSPYRRRTIDIFDKPLFRQA